MSRTQCARVLALSKRFNGVCQADLLAPDVADDGPPITRVAARLWDLEQEGYEFEHIGTRKRCKVFRLIEAERSADERRADCFVESGPASSGATRAGVSAPLSPDDSKSTPSDAKSGSSEPQPLFKIGKPQFGWADQGELDAA